MKAFKQSQTGFVSIIMALVIMLLVTLLALGFAFLARQNQEQNQNRQLSTQAFYAAESGVDDASSYISGVLKSTGSPPADVSSCTNTPFGAGHTSSVGSTNSAVKYTCVMYQTAPKSLEYVLDSQNSKVIRVQAQGGTRIDSITIGWRASSGSTQFATTTNNHSLPQASYSANNGDNLNLSTGIVRATLIPASSLTRSNLNAGSQTLFLYPKAGPVNTPGTQAYLTSFGNPNDPNQGVFSDGNCNASAAQTMAYCNVTVTGLSTANSSIFYIRLRSFYQNSKVTVSAMAGGAQAQLINEQALVDATGKADNVLRRIQVRIPLNIDTNRPEYATETIDSFCKRLVVWPGGGKVDDSSLPGVSGSPAACQVP
jgi:Tfp pilus assembly protein PilX